MADTKHTQTLSERLKDLSEKATQRGWRVIPDPCHFDTLSDIVAGEERNGPPPRQQMVVSVGGYAQPIEQEANAALIAALVNGYRSGQLVVNEWRPIAEDTAFCVDEIHIRGLWVTNNRTGNTHWEWFRGFLNENGCFVDVEYGESVPWDADDFTHWRPDLPAAPKETNDD